MKNKKMNKTTILFILISMLIISMSISVYAEAAEYTFTHAALQPENHIANTVHQDFIERLTTLSDERIEVNYFPGGVLGDEIEMMEQIQTGSITTARLTGAPLGNLEEGFMIMNLPFLFSGAEHMLESLRSEKFADLVNEKIIGEGIRPLDYWWMGVRDLYTTNTKVTSIDDVEGLSLRTWQDKYVVKSWQNLGASPTAISFDELYMSMQTGTVDGGEGWAASYVSNGFYEPAPYLTKLGYIQIASAMVISEDMWQQLPQDLKEVVAQAAKENAEFALGVFKDYESEVYDEAREAGAEVLEVDDISKWQEPIEPLYNEFGEEYGSEYADYIDWVLSIK